MLPRVQFRIQPKRTALLIVDMQNDFLLPGAQGFTPDGLKVIPNIRKLSDSCRSAGIPVVYIRHVLRRDGSDAGILGEIFGGHARSIVLEGSTGAEIHRDLKPEKGDIVIKKLRFSAFQGTELETLLRSKGMDTVIIAGVTTETCCSFFDCLQSFVLAIMPRQSSRRSRDSANPTGILQGSGAS
jgi:nicotinamidase-related amidase